MPEVAPSKVRGPARAGERAIAPDLARGCMLLLIVLSNTGFFLLAESQRSTVDRVVTTVMGVVLDMRVYPMFAFLIGYGMVQLYRRQLEAGASPRAGAALLRRRGLWMMVFGLGHAALLLSTDVLGAWGLLTLVLSRLFLRRGDRTLLVWCGIGVVFLALMVAGAQMAAGELTLLAEDTPQDTVSAAGTGERSYWASVPVRLLFWLGVISLTVALLTAPIAMLAGIWAARRRVLEEPGNHLRLLGWTAAGGIAIGWLGALPLVLTPGGAGEAALFLLHAATGLAGGLGYAAMFGLIAHRLPRRLHRCRPVVALCAVGKRSLSCYLTHSLIFAPLLAAWGLGLGALMTSSTMALFATGVWLVTVFAAYALERAGRRGPAEVVLRRLVYRRPSL
ncbi:DUF418 domain-containing protein [Nonomuraea sp. SYSU D8015]|uniref:DUF418 domain-containing protein n=1 Tax=Nonomuraea sp. SYSU D8015 TaxID=2593644 RepID=UPI00166178BB|nr:DUF418 domain-containing protein [Nonomuraea sp. SYSU D8015]